MPLLLQLRLNQGKVARVVDQVQVICEFRIEANRENIFLERNRMRLQQVTPRKGTHSTNCLNDHPPDRLKLRTRGGDGSRRDFWHGRRRDGPARCRAVRTLRLSRLRSGWRAFFSECGW